MDAGGCGPRPLLPVVRLAANSEKPPWRCHLQPTQNLSPVQLTWPQLQGSLRDGSRGAREGGGSGGLGRKQPLHPSVPTPTSCLFPICGERTVLMARSSGAAGAVTPHLQGEQPKLRPPWCSSEARVLIPAGLPSQPNAGLRSPDHQALSRGVEGAPAGGRRLYSSWLLSSGYSPKQCRPESQGGRFPISSAGLLAGPVRWCGCKARLRAEGGIRPQKGRPVGFPGPGPHCQGSPQASQGGKAQGEGPGGQGSGKKKHYPAQPRPPWRLLAQNPAPCPTSLPPSLPRQGWRGSHTPKPCPAPHPKAERRPGRHLTSPGAARMTPSSLRDPDPETASTPAWR